MEEKGEKKKKKKKKKTGEDLKYNSEQKFRYTSCKLAEWKVNMPSFRHWSVHLLITHSLRVGRDRGVDKQRKEEDVEWHKGKMTRDGSRETFHNISQTTPLPSTTFKIWTASFVLMQCHKTRTSFVSACLYGMFLYPIFFCPKSTT